MSLASIGGGQLGATCAHALVVMSVSRLPAGTAERYLEEFLAAPAELDRSGTGGLLKHALGIVYTSWRLSTAVTGNRSQPGRTCALRALAHLGLVLDGRCDRAYVFPFPDLSMDRELRGDG